MIVNQDEGQGGRGRRHDEDRHEEHARDVHVQMVPVRMWERYRHGSSLLRDSPARLKPRSPWSAAHHTDGVIREAGLGDARPAPRGCRRPSHPAAAALSGT